MSESEAGLAIDVLMQRKFSDAMGPVGRVIHELAWRESVEKRSAMIPVYVSESLEVCVNSIVVIDDIFLVILNRSGEP